MNTQIKYTLLVVALLLLTVLLTACSGDRGEAGIQGIPGPVTPVTSSPLEPSTTCPAGGMTITVGSTTTNICNGVIGPAGVPGEVGNTGSPGADGSPGTNATPVQVVQFCPGVTVYPSAFLEIGLIINGALYAVYSVNDGFLSRIPPGSYSSNAVGSSCNFTVNPDLTISH